MISLMWKYGKKCQDKNHGSGLINIYGLVV